MLGKLSNGYVLFPAVQNVVSALRVLFQRNNVLTGIAVFNEREMQSAAYTLVDRTFDTCMFALFPSPSCTECSVALNCYC